MGVERADPRDVERGTPSDDRAQDPEADGGTEGGLVSRAFSAMRDRNFRLLYLGNMLQFGAQQMQLLVRGYLVYQITGSFALLGTIALASAVPGVLLSPIGGVMADRMTKKTIIQLAQGFNAVNAGVLALLAWGGIPGFHLELWHLFASSALQGGVSSLMMPSRQSMISDLVGPKRLMNAVAVNSSGQTLMQLIGPAVGGVLVEYLSPSAVFWTMTAMFTLAVTFTMRLPAHPLYSYDRSSGTHPRHARSRGGLSDVVDGMSYVWHNPVLRALIAVNFMIVVVAMPYTMLLAGYVEAVLQKGGFELGMLQSVQGVGAILGSFIIASSSPHGRGKMMIFWGAFVGVALIAFAASSNYWLTMGIMFVVGIGQTGRMAIGQVLIQTYAADEYRGRVTAVWFMQFSLVQLGTFFVGILAELLGPQLAIGGLAALMVVTMGFVWVFVPRIRNLD